MGLDDIAVEDMTVDAGQNAQWGTDDFGAIAHLVQQTAQQHQSDGLALLALLRLLEALHRDIRDELFQDTMPKNRQALYSLLKDIETEGGWPYIPRMKLKDFLVYLLQESEISEHTPHPDSRSRS